MNSLTKKQHEVLRFIEGYIEKEGFSPTFREIKNHFNFSSLGSVYRHLQALKKKGKLTAEKNAPRSLMLQSQKDIIDIKSKPTVDISFIGTIKAGSPIETFTRSEWITLPKSYVLKPEESYILKVKGDSLKEEQMCDGDLLVIEARSTAQPGEMTVVQVNGHDTLIKKYFPETPYVRLEGLNPNVKPIILREENLEIQGVLTGLLRLY